MGTGRAAPQRRGIPIFPKVADEEEISMPPPAR